VIKKPKLLFKPKLSRKGEDRFIFTCNSCHFDGRVYTECREEGSNMLYKIELIQHELSGARYVEMITICEKPKGDTIHHHFCGNCGRIISSPDDVDYIISLYGHDQVETKD